MLAQVILSVSPKIKFKKVKTKTYSISLQGMTCSCCHIRDNPYPCIPFIFIFIFMGISKLLSTLEPIAEKDVPVSRFSGEVAGIDALGW